MLLYSDCVSTLKIDIFPVQVVSGDIARSLCCSFLAPEASSSDFLIINSLCVENRAEFSQRLRPIIKLFN